LAEAFPTPKIEIGPETYGAMANREPLGSKLNPLLR
jgi:hypothetical protein